MRRFFSAAVGALLAAVAGCDRGERQAPRPPAERTAKPAAAPSPGPSPVASSPSPAPSPARPDPAAAPAAEAIKPPQPTGPLFTLPTKNDALLRGDPGAFYMFVDRYVPETKATITAWEGGGYGFVRNPRQTSSGEVFTRFHEGIDIAPVERDAKGEPQDVVRAVADGTVAYCTATAAGSNYGHYVVVEHPCGERSGSFFSLCAHLRRIDVRPGMAVTRGTPLGLMGYTGAGIDRRRAHCHLELCLLLSTRFDDYHARHFKLPNGHGNFHGSNLIGLDVAAFLKAAHARPGLRPDEFLAGLTPYWRVLIPNKEPRELEIATRYPWLRRPGAPAASWEISFDGAGVPLAVAPSTATCSWPVVSWVKPWSGYHSWNTRSLLGGSGPTATLTGEGSRYVQLVSGDFEPAPAPPPAVGPEKSRDERPQRKN